MESADRKTIQKNTEIENVAIFSEKKYEPSDSLSMTMENQILLDRRSLIDSGLVTEIFSQYSTVSDENVDLETAVINSPIEEGLLSSQDNHLWTVNVGETLLDHFKYPVIIENQKAIVEVEVYPPGNNSCGDEDHKKSKELNLPEEAGHRHSPYLPSNGVHFLSSVAMQHENCGVPTSSIFFPEGTVNQNVRMIPVFSSFIPPVAESSSDTCGLPQTGASVCDEIVICQLEESTQMLYVNCCDTQELKPVHQIPEYHKQHNYLQSDVENPVTAVLGQFLLVPGEVVLYEQEACPDGNSEAFLPKTGKKILGEINPHHNKGCNCKHSGCFSNYCECFEAKVMCSSICKCIDCTNCEESPDETKQLNVLNYMDIRNNDENSPVLTSTFKTLAKLRKDRQPAMCISWEEVKLICACLLVQAEEAEKSGYSLCLAEQMIMEEFGRCLSQILRA